MAEPAKSLYQRLQERRAALTAGDPTGASAVPNAPPVRAETAPNAPKPKLTDAQRKARIAASMRN